MNSVTYVNEICNWIIVALIVVAAWVVLYPQPEDIKENEKQEGEKND